MIQTKSQIKVIRSNMREAQKLFRQAKELNQIHPRKL